MAMDFIVDLKAAVENLAGQDERRAEDAARWLCTYCDGTTGDKTSRRASVGQIRGIWPAFHKALNRPSCKDLRSAALDALGFIAFEDALNSAAIASNSSLLDSVADIIKQGSGDERVAAAGTIANLTVSDDNMTSKIFISRHASLITNLAEVFDTARTTTSDRLVQFRAVGAFNNMARSTDAAALLDSRGIPPVLERFLHSVIDHKDQEILVARTAMAIAGLAGRLEFSNLPRKGSLLQLVVTCLEHAINRMEGGNGMFGNVLWTASVVLYPVYQLSIADVNKVDLAEAGVVEQLLRLVQVWKESEGTRDLEWSLLTLEQLSFNQECRDRIRSVMLPADEDDESLSALACLQRVVALDPSSELPKTRDTGGSIGQLVANVLSNVCPEMAPMGSPVSAAGDGGGQWVMISYNWDVQERAKELCEGLQAQGMLVWMDILEGCMEGDTLQAMANAVGNAAVVLVCVTSKYKESANCRREASYAHDLKKPIIPVIMEESYQPDASWGWLGLIIAGKLYYDLSDPTRFQSQLAALARAEELEGVKRVAPRSLKSIVKRMRSSSIKSKSGSVLSRSSTNPRCASAGTLTPEVTAVEAWRRARADASARIGSQGSFTSQTLGSEHGGIVEEGSQCSGVSPRNSAEARAEEPLPAEVLAWLDSLGRDMGRDNAWVFAKHRLISLDRIAALTDHDLSSEIEPLIPAVGHRVLLRQGLRVLRQQHKASRNLLQRRRRHLCDLDSDRHDAPQCPLM